MCWVHKALSVFERKFVANIWAELLGTTKNQLDFVQLCETSYNYVKCTGIRRKRAKSKEHSRDESQGMEGTQKVIKRRKESSEGDQGEDKEGKKLEAKGKKKESKEN